MPRESDQYMRVKMQCPVCYSMTYCRILARRCTSSLYCQCPGCKGDMVAAVIPDEAMDNAKQKKGLWIVPLYDLIYVGERFTEEEGDRLLWGLENVFESRINEFLKGESV